MKKSELREMIKEEMIREGDDIEDIIKDSEVKLKMILKSLPKVKIAHNDWILTVQKVYKQLGYKDFQDFWKNNKYGGELAHQFKDVLDISVGLKYSDKIDSLIKYLETL